jgi:DNA polymerase-1
MAQWFLMEEIMAKLFDIETNGFLDTVNKIWCLVIQDSDTKEVLQYSDYDPDLPSIADGLDVLSNAKVIAGHNVIGYDLPVLKKLLDWEPNKDTTVYDTWIMSQVLRYKRGHLHGLEGWGSKLNYPKIEFSNFDGYTKEMLTYCTRDVELNTKVYSQLVEEAKRTISINPMFKKGLQVEMEFLAIESEIRNKGWVFDMPCALELLKEMSDKMTAIEQEIEPQIGLVLVKRDKEDEYKEPTYRKDGHYTAVTTKWFDIDPASGLDPSSRLVNGPYCRIEFEQGSLSSDKVLKSFLYSIGWKPDDFNYKRVNGKFIPMSPKLTETSLEILGDIGRKISEYNSIKNRRGILAGWIEEAEKDSRLHGRMWTIGTPTFRCRHEVVANLPSVGAMYGAEMRSLLKCEEGKVIVGADSAGNQMRGLCHYIGNDDFTNEVINGDVHQKNADILSQIIPTPRKTAKPWLYAYLFGAGATKLGTILAGYPDKHVGEASAKLFESAIPGLKELKDKLNKQFNDTTSMFGKENAFIRGIDGRIVFVNSQHQVLNYLLQTAEGVTCKAAAVYLKHKLKEENIEHYFVIHYHDELAVVVDESLKEHVAKLAVEAFREAPKWFGVMCMDGDAKTGYNYAEVH